MGGWVGAGKGGVGVESVWRVTLPQVKFPTSELLTFSGLVSTTKLAMPINESPDLLLLCALHLYQLLYCNNLFRLRTHIWRISQI